MKRIATGIFIAVAVCYSAISAVLPENSTAIPVLIMHVNGITASGCFLQLSNSVYLVTARHAIFTAPDKTNSASLVSPSAVIKSASGAGTSNLSMRVVMLKLDQLCDAGEVRASANHDVALVRIEEVETNDPNIVKSVLPGVVVLPSGAGVSVHSVSLCGRLSTIEVGADVFMFGYPTSLTSEIKDLFPPTEPLLRKGVVAGISDKGVVVIDCPSYFGNSGGPVMEVDHPNAFATQFKIIGLVSGFVPFQEEWENKTMHYSHILKSNSGYTIIEPIDYALDLAWK